VGAVTTTRLVRFGDNASNAARVVEQTEDSVRKRVRIAAAVVAAIIGAGGIAAGTAAAAPSLPGLPGLPAGASTFTGDATECEMTRPDEYPTTAPESVGVDSAATKAAIDYWTTVGASETVKVFRHGCLIGQSGTDPLLERVPRQNWSQTKTVSTLIAGVAEKQGLIHVDDAIGDYLPEGLGDEAHRKITIRNVLNMTTGLELNWVRGLNLFGDISRTREATMAGVEHEPGEYFEYDQTTPTVLNYVVQQAIKRAEPGTDYETWAQREFWNKLGVPASAYWWQRDRAGTPLGYSQLFLRPLEFGRLGELMLEKGTYAGQEIIRQGYIEELQTGTEANCGYGFMVWLNSCSAGEHQVNASIFARRVIDPARAFIEAAPSDMYYSWGYHGQHTFVIPSLDMVITRSGEVPPDAVEDATRLDGDAAIAGSPKVAYDTFFHTLMNGVTDMSDEVRATIANPDGPYTAEPDLNVDPDGFLYPVDAAPGTYLAVGPQAPEGCTVAGCEQEPNDGLRWVTDVPRTVPGIAGAEERPTG
jgi:CubicO group peptidase (beta-lactamase class C family)